jgi:GntR family transcriptional regulator/MocR family aminotransferase
MFIKIDPDKREPLQQQIYQELRRAIDVGLLAPGARLPSSRALSSELGVARLTVVLAIEQLLAEGYVYSRVGAGTYVNRQRPDAVPIGLTESKALRTRHPGLSTRGLRMSAAPRVIRKIHGPPRAFRIGVPALDKFPIALWNRLVSRRMRSSALTQLEYADAAGLLALREAIATHVSRSRGTRCTGDQVILVAGAQQALDLIARLLLDPNDSVWIEEPGYPGAHAAFAAAGANIGFASVDAEGLALHPARVSPRLIFTTPSHQFPLGVPMTIERRETLLQFASRSDAWIIEDDYDSEFRYGLPPLPCLHGLDPEGRVIYVGSFSKTLFPALRLGYLIVPPDLHSPMVKARLAADIHPHAVLQSALADFISDGHFERHLRRMNRIYQERLDALEHAVHRYARHVLKLRPVTTGLHAVVDLHDLDDEQVFSEAMRLGVESMPLSAYYLGLQRAPQPALVLGFGGVPPKSISESVKQLVKAGESVARRATTARFSA